MTYLTVILNLLPTWLQLLQGPGRNLAAKKIRRALSGCNNKKSRCARLKLGQFLPDAHFYWLYGQLSAISICPCS
jgi:hypothetical protein